MLFSLSRWERAGVRGYFRINPNSNELSTDDRNIEGKSGNFGSIRSSKTVFHCKGKFSV
jgi:hypothetical protein